MYKITEIQNIDLSQKDLIIFFGKSGCGKSTTIDYLLKQHDSFKNLTKTYIHGGPINWAKSDQNLNDLVIIDETIKLIDIYHIFLILRKGKKILVASHLPKLFHYPFCLFSKCSLITLDQKSQRIEALLKDKKVTYSQSALQYFVKKYKANFTDLKIILDQFPDNDFDLALSQFERSCQLSYSC